MSTSLSTALPRPMTLPGPTTARSRTKDWSPRIAPSATCAPASTIARQHTTAPASTTSGFTSPRAVECFASLGGLPSTAPSWISTPSPTTVPSWITTCAPMRTPSPSETSAPRTSPAATSDGCILPPPRRVQCLLEPLEHPHHAQSGRAVGPRQRAGAERLHEVLALQPQRFAVGDPGAVDVARAGDVLAVAGPRQLVEALVVDRHLALDVHVVEGRHPPGTNDGEAPLLVRVQPREVQMGGQAGREAHETEHHVLDPPAHVRLPSGAQLVGLLLGQVQHHRDVVGAQRPQRVLVRAELPEVEPVGVDVVDVAELARGGDLLELGHAGVVLEQVADHQHAPRPLGGRHGALGLRHRLRERLLHEAMLARVEHPLGQGTVGGDRRGEYDRVERVVAQQVVEVGGEARAGERGLPALARLLRGVAAPGQLAAGDGREVARQVRAPVPEPRHADPHAATRSRSASSACTTRSPARPSPYSGGRSAGMSRSSASRATPASSPTTTLQPAPTVY